MHYSSQTKELPVPCQSAAKLPALSKIKAKQNVEKQQIAESSSGREKKQEAFADGKNLLPNISTSGKICVRHTAPEPHSNLRHERVGIKYQQKGTIPIYILLWHLYLHHQQHVKLWEIFRTASWITKS